MKKIIFTLSMIFTSSLVFSQGFRNMEPEEMAKRDTEQLKERLGLNEKQEKLSYDISLKNAEKMKEVFNSNAGNREAMRSSMLEIRQERDSSYQVILTDWQFEEYKKFQEERMEQRRQRQGGGGQGRQ